MADVPQATKLEQGVIDEVGIVEREIGEKEADLRKELTDRLAQRRVACAAVEPDLRLLWTAELGAADQERLAHQLAVVLDMYKARWASRTARFKHLKDCIQAGMGELGGVESRHQASLRQLAEIHERMIGDLCQHARGRVSLMASDFTTVVHATDAAYTAVTEEQDTRLAGAAIEHTSVLDALTAARVKDELAVDRARRKHIAAARILFEQELVLLRSKQAELVKAHEMRMQPKQRALAKARARHQAVLQVRARVERRVQWLGGLLEQQRQTLTALRQADGQSLEEELGQVARHRAALSTHLTRLRAVHEANVVRLCRDSEAVERQLRGWLELLIKLPCSAPGSNPAAEALVGELAADVCRTTRRWQCRLAGGEMAGSACSALHSAGHQKSAALRAAGMDAGAEKAADTSRSQRISFEA